MGWSIQRTPARMRPVFCGASPPRAERRPLDQDSVGDPGQGEKGEGGEVERAEEHPSSISLRRPPREKTQRRWVALAEECDILFRQGQAFSRPLRRSRQARRSGLRGA